MSSFALGDVRNYTSMHACTHVHTPIAGSAAVEESSMLATGAVGRRLQYPECGRSMRSHCRSPWNFQFNPICGWHQHGRLHQYVNGLHHYGVEGTTACQQGSWIHSIRRHSSNSIATSTIQAGEELGTAQSGSDEDGRVHTALASWPKYPEKSSVFPIQELKAASTATTVPSITKYFTQVFPKPATV